MNTLEKNLVKTVAKLAPWLAPFPSAYFVARSSMTHLALPLPVAIVVAAIIETLGLATVHTALWAWDWNANKHKSDPAAPVLLTIALGAVYVVATLGLVVFLEVWPALAAYAPALFPALAVVGALNLVMISRQELREAAVKEQKAEAKARRTSRKTSKTTAQGAQQPAQMGVQNPVLNTSWSPVNLSKRERKARHLDAMLDIYRDSPETGATDISRQLGIGRSTVYTYISELEGAGQIRKNGHGVEILEASA